MYQKFVNCEKEPRSDSNSQGKPQTSKDDFPLEKSAIRALLGKSSKTETEVKTRSRCFSHGTKRLEFFIFHFPVTWVRVSTDIGNGGCLRALIECEAITNI